MRIYFSLSLLSFTNIKNSSLNLNVGNYVFLHIRTPILFHSTVMLLKVWSNKMRKGVHSWRETTALIGDKYNETNSDNI
jgi:hypothetical protein